MTLARRVVICVVGDGCPICGAWRRPQALLMSERRIATGVPGSIGEDLDGVPCAAAEVTGEPRLTATMLVASYIGCCGWPGVSWRTMAQWRTLSPEPEPIPFGSPHRPRIVKFVCEGRSRRDHTRTLPARGAVLVACLVLGAGRQGQEGGCKRCRGAMGGILAFWLGGVASPAGGCPIGAADHALLAAHRGACVRCQPERRPCERDACRLPLRGRECVLGV